MRRFIFLVFLFSALTSPGQKKQVCFSFDDLPVVTYGIQDSTYQKGIFNKLVGSLKTNQIPAIGFVNERKLYAGGKLSPYQVALLKSWVNNGLDLGNHTFSHLDYNAVSLGNYAKDIVRGAKITRQLRSKNGRSTSYFRHPFLHVGNTRAKADSLSDFLAGHGYRVAPVTIDDEDYLFALAYKRAKEQKDTALTNRIGRDYLAYMESKLKYFEKQSDKLFGRNISQILLVHANLLNADYLNSLAAVYRKNNYIFVSMDQALEDEAYQTPITVFGKWGISWLDRWALSQGKKGEFFKEEPETPDYIKKMAE